MLFKKQIIPIVLTVVTFLVLTLLLWIEIRVLNLFGGEDIKLHIRVGDILVGLTIYLKTSIDFAIYIGRLMQKNPSTRARIAIELGTAMGNAAGTMVILLIWTIFKEVTWLLAIMIFVAALVLFRLAEEGLEHINLNNPKMPKLFKVSVRKFADTLKFINKKIAPLLQLIIPSTKMNISANLTFWSLFGLAFSVPFILGLDDFAGYVPLFNIVNVFGFAIGVFGGHMILNMLLYISPKHTIAAVKNSVISLLGSIAFVALGLWGIIEVIKLLIHH